MRKFRNFHELLKTSPGFAEAVALVAKEENGLEKLVYWKKTIDNLATSFNEEEIEQQKI